MDSSDIFGICLSQFGTYLEMSFDHMEGIDPPNSKIKAQLTLTDTQDLKPIDSILKPTRPNPQ